VKRELLRALAGPVVAGLILGAVAAPTDAKKVIVLGFDGLDPDLVEKMMDEGRLPHLRRIAKEGYYSKLGTSIPPQSPVAWSNFITGMDSGGHGVFDFLHRDPEMMFPVFSTSVPDEGERAIEIGKYRIPLSGGEHRLLRRGKPFWETLEENGIPTMIIRMPANFPVTGKATIELSGMGTPDVRGTYGSFSFYTSDRAEFAGKDVGGGTIYNVRVRNHTVKSRLEGPQNPFLKEKKRARAEFSVHIDPEEPFAFLRIGGEEHLLEVGEWTDWIPFDLELLALSLPWFGEPLKIPVQTIPVMGRFYLKQLRPHFKLYVTPLDYDPINPGIPMAHPISFAREMAEAVGRYYTEGMPEDTSALDGGALTPAEFLAQAAIAGSEILEEFPWVLEKFQREFDEGLLFYYTGNHDQVGHMLYRTMDPEHPAYDPEVHAQFADAIPRIIEGLDDLVGYTLENMDDETTLVVMSDHGFASWRRAMNLNTWLYQKGYLALKNPDITNDPGYFMNVDWPRTRVYAMGINGLYVNLRGREKWGTVDPADRRSLMEQVAHELVREFDPETGLQAITKVYIAEDAYQDRGALDIGPDMVVGYAKGMRGSNESALGEFPPEVFMDNYEEWSADHCMDHTTVPGVLFSTRPLKKPAPTLRSLPAALLAEFGIGGFPGDAEEGLEAIGYIAATK
jgi:predicted AlkP superfamily phosphohydrolase/phosphomutase